MDHESTPGKLATCRCPGCGECVAFIMSGGPLRLACPDCGSTISLDVVHDGRKWTIRRVRRTDGASR